VLIIFVIGILRKDPLPTGILDVFFLEISDHSSLCKTEVIYLKFHQIYNGFNSNNPSRGQQFNSILSLEFGFILHLLSIHVVRRSSTVTDGISFCTAISARCFVIFLLFDSIESMGVS
jgi:hypothetical protein